MEDDMISRDGTNTDAIATDAQPAPASLDAPETEHGKGGGSENAPQGAAGIYSPERIQGARTSNPEKDFIACLDCEERAEFVTFSDPPLAKCFRCAILKAMDRFCGLCNRDPVECIVRAIGENQRRDVIGVCSGCFSKRLSGMVN